MLVPAAIHGRYRDCDARARRAVALVAKGMAFTTAFAGEWVDLASSDEPVVLDGPSPLLGGDPCFHVYLPLAAVFRAIGKHTLPMTMMEAVFTDALTAPWGVLGLCGQANQIWTVPPARGARFLRALVPCWDELLALGRRYTCGSREPSALWSLSYVVRGVLVRHGIDQAELVAQPTAEQLAGFVDRLG